MKEKIRSYIMDCGADVCGFGEIDRYDDSPEGFRPTDILPECKSVISFGIALPKGVFESPHRLIYSYFNAIVCPMLDNISFKAAKYIEREYGCVCVPLPSDGPYDEWNEKTLRGHGVLSMKHLGIGAGLGQIGKSSLLINEKYGNRLCFGAVLTDLNIESDRLSPDMCIKSCTRCIDSCPQHAIKDKKVEQLLCRPNTYGQNARGFDVVLCNKCRMVCPMRLGKG